MWGGSRGRWAALWVCGVGVWIVGYVERDVGLGGWGAWARGGRVVEVIE